MSSERKYRVSFWIEWSSLPAYLWAEDDYTTENLGMGIRLINEQVPLSHMLRKRGNELAKWFQFSLNWDSPADPSPWTQEERERFNIAARAFFNDLVKELGYDYELIYKQDESDF